MTNSLRPSPLINIDPADLKSYSIVRAINSMLTPSSQRRSTIEHAISDAIAQQIGRTPQGMFVPTSLRIDHQAADRIALAMGRSSPIATSGSGGALVGQEFLIGSLIDALRAASRVIGLGATVIGGMKGNVAIPRMNTTSTLEWIAPEGSDIPESEGTFSQVNMVPKTAASYAMITRGLLAAASMDVEFALRRDFARTFAAGIDLAAIAGTGANGQPTGLLNSAGIQSVAIGANGGPLTYDAMVALETSLANANADQHDPAYLTNSKQVAAMRNLVDGNGRPLWNYYPDPDQQPAKAPGHFNGYRTARSNNAPGNLTKGTGTNLSAVIFANWSDLIIADWGVLEIAVNPNGPGFASGGVEIRAMQSVDVAVARPLSFVAITDAA